MVELISNNTRENRLATLAGSTIIIWFFSEMFFQNEGAHFYVWSQRESTAQVLLDLSLMFTELLLFYGFFVAWFLVAIAYFRVRSLWALAFAAVICGWAIEGSVLPIMYAEMPLGLLWPAASWHVLINVFLGWWLLRKIIESRSFSVVTIVFSLLGAWWSLWSTWYWPLSGSGNMETLSLPMTPADFTFVALYSGTALAIGYWLLGKYGNKGFNLSDKSALIFFAVASVLTVIFSQTFSLIFFVLVGLAVLFLWRNRKDEKQPNILSTISKNTPTANYLAVLSMPLVAAMVYAVLYEHNISLNAYIYLVLWPLIMASLALFLYSGYRIFKN
jgi:hypothetical protein